MSDVNLVQRQSRHLWALRHLRRTIAQWEHPLW